MAPDCVHLEPTIAPDFPLPLLNGDNLEPLTVLGGHDLEPVIRGQ